MRGLDGVSLGNAFVPGIIGEAASFDGVDDWVSLGTGLEVFSGVSYGRICAWKAPSVSVLTGRPNRQLLDRHRRHQRPVRPHLRLDLAGVERPRARQRRSGLWRRRVCAVLPSDRHMDVGLRGRRLGQRHQAALDRRGPSRPAQRLVQTGLTGAGALYGHIAGEDGGSGQFFAGRIDEVRLSTTPVSAQWLRLEHEATRDSSAVVAAPETAP